MPMKHTRRRFLANLSLAGTTTLLRAPPLLAADSPPETTTIRLVKDFVICEAPLDVAEELLRAEGFADVRYVDIAPPRVTQAIVGGEVDFGLSFPVFFLPEIDSGLPSTVLAGVHIGCFELFARDGIRSIAELRGRSVGLKRSPPGLLTLMAIQVGLDPAKDIYWVTDPSLKPLDLFADAKIDAFLAFPPEPQELRARRAGHVIFSTALDRPWSQYFCCMLLGNRDYIRNHPVATKRLLRAILKTADLCATDPEFAARRLVDGGFTERYDYARQTLNDVPFNYWRDYDAEDTIRYYALRMHEAGLIKSSPQKIIAEGTDWRFFNELKRELKA